MKNVFPGLSIICGTALLIAGNVTAGIVFATLGFLGAVMGAALRHQQEQEAIKVMKEFTEVTKTKEGVDTRLNDLAESVGQFGGAMAELIAAFTAGNKDPYDPFGGGGNGTLQ